MRGDVVYSGRGDYVKALTFYERFVDRESDDPELQRRMAVATARATNVLLLLGEVARRRGEAE